MGHVKIPVRVTSPKTDASHLTNKINVHYAKLDMSYLLRRCVLKWMTNAVVGIKKVGNVMSANLAMLFLKKTVSLLIHSKLKIIQLLKILIRIARILQIINV